MKNKTKTKRGPVHKQEKKVNVQAKNLLSNVEIVKNLK